MHKHSTKYNYAPSVLTIFKGKRKRGVIPGAMLRFSRLRDFKWAGCHLLTIKQWHLGNKRKAEAECTVTGKSMNDALYFNGAGNSFSQSKL